MKELEKTYTAAIEDRLYQKWLDNSCPCRERKEEGEEALYHRNALRPGQLHMVTPWTTPCREIP